MFNPPGPGSQCMICLFNTVSAPLPQNLLLRNYVPGFGVLSVLRPVTLIQPCVQLCTVGTRPFTGAVVSDTASSTSNDSRRAPAARAGEPQRAESHPSVCASSARCVRTGLRNEAEGSTALCRICLSSAQLCADWSLDSHCRHSTHVRTQHRFARR